MVKKRGKKNGKYGYFQKKILKKIPPISKRELAQVKVVSQKGNFSCIEFFLIGLPGRNINGRKIWLLLMYTELIELVFIA
jgi:hypothetical protein